MPALPDPPAPPGVSGAPRPSEPSGGPGPPRPGGSLRRVQPTGHGPVLIEGPVEIVLADGVTVRSDRPVVALCTCGRSRRYPFCDTSHRRHRPGGSPGPGSPPGPGERSAAQ